MRVGIQILNHNGLNWLPGLLDSLIRFGANDQVIYLVDNCSTDSSIDFVASRYPEVVIIPLEQNWGYGQAYNRSVPRAFADGCDWVCLQNTDTVVTKDWLKPLARVAASDPRTGVMGPVFWEWETDTPNYYMQGRCPEVVSCMLDPNHPPFSKEWIEGSSFFIRKKCFEQIGGFDPLYFMYWEDAEYCRRARYFGWRVNVVPGSVCRHHAKGSAAKPGPGFLELRNHFLFKMTDPSSDLLTNLGRAVRLGMTHFKQALVPLNWKRVAEVLHSGGSATLLLNRCRCQTRAVRLAKQQAGAGNPLNAS